MVKKVKEKALAIVDKVVEDMPEREKQKIIDEILENKNSRDYVLKLLLWVSSGKNIMHDVKKKKNLVDVVRRLENMKKKRLQAKTQGKGKPTKAVTTRRASRPMGMVKPEKVRKLKLGV